MNKKLLLILIIFLSTIVPNGYCETRIPGLQVIDTVDEDSDSIPIFDASTNKTKRIHPSAIAPGATYNYTETATTVTNANVVNEATTVTNSDLTIESGATYNYTENATTVTNADTVNAATNVTTATDISGTATNVTTATDISGTATNITTATEISGTATNTTTATDISGTATNVTTATDISGTATNVTTATDISGTATNVTNATDISGTATEISGTATNVTTATDISGTATNVTTATDISGTATTISGTVTTVTTATDISGTATNVTTATDISGTATNVTTATDISGTATTVTSATDISGQAYNSTFNGSVGTVNEVTDEIGDADGDTKIQVEESADEDKVRVDIAGIEHLLIEETAASLTQAGTFVITDTTSAASTNAINIFAPNLSNGGAHRLRMGVSASSYNSGTLSFDFTSAGSTSNFFAVGMTGVGDVIKVDGSGNVGIGATSTGAKLYVSGTIDFDSIDSGATKAEINSRCDGVPSYSGSDTTGVTVTAGGDVVTVHDLGTVTNGDVFYIESAFTYTKGGTGGKSNYYIAKSAGTATIAFPAAAISCSWEDAASTLYNKHLGGMCFVTGSGTLSMHIVGFSDGSNSSISSGACDLATTFIKKQ
jgi:hypothetical protein